MKLVGWALEHITNIPASRNPGSRAPTGGAPSPYIAYCVIDSICSIQLPRCSLSYVVQLYRRYVTLDVTGLPVADAAHPIMYEIIYLPGNFAPVNFCFSVLYFWEQAWVAGRAQRWSDEASEVIRASFLVSLMSWKPFRINQSGTIPPNDGLMDGDTRNARE